jgi:hypothetical protein
MVMAVFWTLDDVAIVGIERLDTLKIVQTPPDF